MIYVRSTVAALVVGSLALTGAAYGQVEQNAKDLLAQSAEAIKGLKDISATSKHFATGPMVKGMVDTSGEFKLIKGADAHRSAGFYKGRAKSVSSVNDDVFHFYLNPDGSQQTVTWVDDTAKTVFTRPLQVRTDSFNQLTLGQQLLIDEIFHADPYAKALQSQKVVIEGTEEIGGERCEVVRASNKDGEAWTLWHISSNDKLPRRREMGVKLQGQEEPVRIVVEWSNVRVNQNLTRKDLEIKVPEGYRVDEQKAVASAGGEQTPPAPPPPRPELGPARAAAAPDFDLRAGSGGGNVKLADLRGNAVVLAFWGSWNGKSKDALPVLEEITKGFQGKPVKVFAAACREKNDEAPEALMKEKGYSFGLLLGADETAKAYKVRGFPSFAVIDAEGNTVDFVQGFRSEDDLREKLINAIRTALGEAPAASAEEEKE